MVQSSNQLMQMGSLSNSMKGETINELYLPMKYSYLRKMFYLFAHKSKYRYQWPPYQCGKINLCTGF